MSEFFIFTVVIIILFGIIIENLRLKNKNSELLFLLTQTNIDNFIIKNNIHNDSNIEKEHFNKFLTESREVAFKYIEEVQKELLEFYEDLESDIDYFSNILPTDTNYEILTKIKNYKSRVLKLLPEDEDGR